MKGGPCYKKYICNKLHGTLFEAFIISARTDWYNIVRSIDAYGRDIQSSSCDGGSSGGGCPLPTNSTTKAF